MVGATGIEPVATAMSRRTAIPSALINKRFGLLIIGENAGTFHETRATCAWPQRPAQPSLHCPPPLVR